MIDLAKSNLVQKARKRPDQVQRVIQKVSAEGLMATWQQVNAKLDTPSPLGYSIAGTVVEVGVDAAEFRVGQRVACAGVGYAMHAEIITAPKTLTVPVPGEVTLDDAAFGTLGAIAMQAVRQCDARVGECVGVVGLGLLGNLVTQILVASGVRVAGVDIDEEKLRLAAELSDATVGTQLQAVADEVSGGRGLDGVIIAAGAADSAIIRQCPAALRHRGRIVVLGFVGMELPREEFYEKELELRMSMSYGPGRYDPSYEEKAHDYPYPFVRWTEQRNIAAFLDLVARNKIRVAPLISHRFSIDDALAAYSLLEGKERYLGIVLNYPGAGAEPPRQLPLGSQRPAPSTAKGIVVVGAGAFVSGILAPILKQLDAPVQAVVTTRGASAVNTANALGAAHASTSLSESLALPGVSHVVIASRHTAHFTQAKAAIEAGNVIHIEKPVCVTREELADLGLVIAEHSAHQRVYTGFNRRYSVLSRLLADELRRRPGVPTTIVYRINAGQVPADHWFYDDPGGRLTAEGCHFIDYCFFLAGSPIVGVSCAAQGFPGRPFDGFTVTLTFACGSQGTIVYSGQGDRALPKERIEVFQGGTCWVNDDWSRLTRYEGGKKRALYSGKQQKGWREAMELFLGSRTNADLAPSWDDIRVVHEAMFDAVDQALGTNKNETDEDLFEVGDS
ncbi:MAG: bi-domain-containing oxidoreductase [Actinomycetia bacterium]|nr:bi-domain-containing oxidoreductase [Actinomycetes bacterium]